MSTSRAVYSFFAMKTDFIHDACDEEEIAPHNIYCESRVQRGEVANGDGVRDVDGDASQKKRQRWRMVRGGIWKQ